MSNGDGKTVSVSVRPRKDYVLLHLIDHGHVRGVAVSQRSKEGKEWRVLAVGPEVLDLKPGDRVEAMGAVGQDIATIPGHQDVYVTRESNILLVHVEGDGE